MNFFNLNNFFGEIEKNEKPIKKKIEVMFFSLSDYEKKHNCFFKYNKNRHVLKSNWLKNQNLHSEPKTVLLEVE